MSLALSNWFYDGVMMNGGVLSIDRAYFDITGGRERWLYKGARKHAGGAGEEGFAISLPTLFEKSGAEGTYRRFKFEMLKLARENGLPGYALEIIEHPSKEPAIRMVRRAALVPAQGEEEVVPPALKRPVRKKAESGETRPEFPADGHIGYTPFGPIAREALPHPQRDLGLIADEFRRFIAARKIPADAINIAQIFATFCSRQSAAS
jgi:hypothetical protein